nr:hypothetical protein [Tanacetum cinerariifolium]
MPDDALRSVSEFETADSDDFHDNDMSTFDHIVQDDYASDERLSLPNHMDRICEEVNSLHSRLEDLESSIAKKSPMKPSHLCQPLSPTLSKSSYLEFSQLLSRILNKKVVKQMNRQFNISYVAQSNRFVTLKKELSKVIKSEKDTNAIPAPTQGEHKIAKNITHTKPSPETQGELAYKESTLPVSEIKINEESTMVLYESEKKDLVDLTTEQDSEDDDDLDKQPLSKRFKIMPPILSKP